EVPDPRRLQRQQPVHVPQDQRGLAAVGAEDERLRAVDAHPGVVAAEVVEVLGRDADAAGEPGRTQAGPRAGQPLAVLRLAEGREWWRHRRWGRSYAGRRRASSGCPRAALAGPTEPGYAEVER